jgi:5-(carboxyamino)imidazole ribonucleotide synthase
VSGRILPGAVIGVLGSGQLGRMFAIAARRMGYRIHVFSPEADSPAGQIADREIVADYDDLDAVRAFGREVEVLTFEFENVPAATAAAAAEHTLVRPAGGVLHVTQNRQREKAFLAGAGIPVPAFAVVDSRASLDEALLAIGVPAVLKTARFGYDGKGQVRIESPADAGLAWATVGGETSVLESLVDYECELSIVAARGGDGGFAHYGVVENQHRDHILDVTIAPADVPDEVARDAVGLARAVLDTLDVVGVLCVELFLARDGRLLVNELAPRPHNSGHFTVDACVTSQFEQQLRAVCGLPLGSTRQLAPAAMANLLGDLWRDGEPRWEAACAYPDVKLHLYGKREARPGRKMGHLTAIAGSAAEAANAALAARRALRLADRDVTAAGTA